MWWTPEEIAEWRDVKAHFINTVLREGKVLYDNEFEPSKDKAKEALEIATRVYDLVRNRIEQSRQGN